MKCFTLVSRKTAQLQTGDQSSFFAKTNIVVLIGFFVFAEKKLDPTFPEVTQQEDSTNYRLLVIILTFYLKFWISSRKLFQRPLGEKDLIFHDCLCRFFLAPFHIFFTFVHTCLAFFSFFPPPRLLLALPWLLGRALCCFKQAGLAKLHTWKKPLKRHLLHQIGSNPILIQGISW